MILFHNSWQTDAKQPIFVTNLWLAVRTRDILSLKYVYLYLYLYLYLWLYLYLYLYLWLTGQNSSHRIVKDALAQV